VKRLKTIYKPINILLVEDNPLDIILTREILTESEVLHKLESVKNGLEALEYLRHPSKAKPDIILLDLNLPRMNGFDLLSEIKADAELQALPVFILTTSTAREDLQRAEAFAVKSYLIKPLDLEKFEEAVLRLRASGLLN
jgi:chemotaxis family two-component system response regulator Rcp1